MKLFGRKSEFKGFVFWCLTMTGFVTGFVSCFSPGCSRDKAAKREKAEATKGKGGSDLPELKIVEKADLVFTFNDGNKFKTVFSIEDIPRSARGWVGVIDPKLRTKVGVGSGRLMYVANLCKKRDDGGYSYEVLTRDAFESRGPVSCGNSFGGNPLGAVSGRSSIGGEGSSAGGATGGEPSGSTGGAAGQRVIVYITNTCPVCIRALRFMKKKGIPFVAKDINKEPSAARELGKKAAASGMRVTGVPVFDVGGKLVKGFDPGQLLKLVGKRK